MFDDDNIEIMKGIYILLNSTFHNRYFKIINGTTQINVTDLNTLPIFPYKVLREISSIKLTFGELNNKICDDIVEKYFEYYK